MNNRVKDILDSIDYYEQIRIVSKDSDTLADCESTIASLRWELAEVLGQV